MIANSFFRVDCFCCRTSRNLAAVAAAPAEAHPPSSTRPHPPTEAIPSQRGFPTYANKRGLGFGANPSPHFSLFSCPGFPFLPLSSQPSSPDKLSHSFVHSPSFSSSNTTMLSIATLALALSAAGLVRAHGNVPSYSIAGQNITAYLPYQSVPFLVLGDCSPPLTNCPFCTGIRTRLRPPSVLCARPPETDRLRILTSSTSSATRALSLRRLSRLLPPVRPSTCSGRRGPTHTRAPSSLTWLGRRPSKPSFSIPPRRTLRTDCAPSITQWDASGAQWFKIDEAGWTKEDGWAGTDVLTNKLNSIWPVQIPANLKAGQYLLRHEIIALHSAGTYPGAQCTPASHAPATLLRGLLTCVRAQSTPAASSSRSRALVARSRPTVSSPSPVGTSPPSLALSTTCTPVMVCAHFLISLKCAAERAGRPLRLRPARPGQVGRRL